jgi:CubicO group peptidase (beta-lactamase class C family)
MTDVKAITDRLRTVLEEQSGPLNVAGAVVAADIGGERIALAHGSANLNTGQQFTTDTGWLLGSVSKVLVTTMLLRFVERGLVDLDEPVQRYVPEFTLSDADAAAAITVRMLVSHTNGIDSDNLMPVPVRGRDAAKSYTEYLPNMGVLFTPGSGIHYSNPGFVLAGRIVEEQTGLPFERAIQQELFDPAGMGDATAVQTQAFLRRTAVGAFADAGGTLRATAMFTLPESGAGAGSTLIVSCDDMLTFGRMHLADGVAPNGERVLSAELAQLMRQQTFDIGLPQAPPVGLGWWLFPIAGTTAYWHGGGSPGGASSFCVIPELDTTIVSFSPGRPGCTIMNDLLHDAVIEELTGRQVTPPLELVPGAPIDPAVAGEYRAFETHMVVDVDGNVLNTTSQFEPYDEGQRRMSEGYSGSTERTTTRAYRSVAPGQFAPEGLADEHLGGFYGRMGLLGVVPEAPGRRAGLHTGFRYYPKVG